ncbi:membrane-associated protease RseP (regulator of RpoE activity) [Nocardioides cavernae]|uniref:Membrane-associated protease RseP (Regulator of RpoE activity) n=1 Tax=Nocardioides cavernae TaxID=1921566 RepID=A0A7Y9H5Q4_9ACTN|nr:hypothetical protein [Nocardioides cavernae]NYE38419.1 membrane-associated protease RseP (regulator of RpoE activity) [Nocardioides cavernae]
MPALPPRKVPDAWWLLAGPTTGIVVGSVLGAVVGFLTTPPDGVGPLVGDPVGSAVLGGVVGRTLGVLAGLVVGAVLMVVDGRDRPTSTARTRAAVVAALCCPAVLLLVASIARVELGGRDIAPLAVVTVAAAVAFAWVAGRAPDRA